MRPAARWGDFVAIAAAVLVVAFALPKAQINAQSIAIDDAPVLAADAAIRAGDKAAARRLLGLQFTLIAADGKAYARKDFLADPKRVAAAPARDIKIHNHGVVATVTGRRKSVQDADVVFLDVWIKQKGAWRALLMQDAPIDAAAAPRPPRRSFKGAGILARQSRIACARRPSRMSSTRFRRP